MAGKMPAEERIAMQIREMGIDANGIVPVGVQNELAARSFTSLGLVREVLRMARVGCSREDELLKVHVLAGKEMPDGS